MGGIADDPVALQVIWTRLIAIADEAAATLRRTSFSPIVRESNDFACVIFDAAGTAMAENTIGIPSFNMTLSRTLAHFLKVRPAGEWHAGDVGICNDPWLTSGHLPDTTVVAPVFADGRLIAWTGSIAHMADMGGTLWSADTREVFEEGLRLPPLLLLRARRVESRCGGDHSRQLAPARPGAGRHRRTGRRRRHRRARLCANCWRARGSTT